VAVRAAGAIRAIRESEGGPLGAVAEGAREALGARFCAVAALRAGPAQRLRDGDGDGAVDPLGRRVAVPVRLEQRIWGALSARCPDGAAAEAADVLAPFAELMSLSLWTDAARRRLSVLAATDFLTGLANRRTFDAALVDACERAARAGSPVSLAVLDLDRFKDVNDRHGHRAGDAGSERSPAGSPPPPGRRTSWRGPGARSSAGSCPASTPIARRRPSSGRGGRWRARPSPRRAG
jgi:hypothetical protein